MIVIAVLAILVGIALPSFRAAIQNNRITGQANEMLAAFSLARSEALRLNRPVTICASSDGEGCVGNWTDGWIVAVDDAAPGVAPGNLNVIRIWPPPEGGTTMTADGNVFRFLPRGELDVGLGGSPGNIVMQIPDCRGQQARTVNVNRSGRVGVTREDCS
ncbi:MAG: GspH/FimT family pseudopilin, partial [Wenzhouxiangella sp.]